MPRDVEPILSPTKISSLRPTQMTVGYREVAEKRAAWRARCEKEGSEFLGQHMIPVVLGPRKKLWMVDHHHLARALHEEGVTHVLTSQVADLSDLGKHAFLTAMDNLNWFHPFDAKGKRQPDDDMPKSIARLKDDPFRSLAGALRHAGGYAKGATPFSEFLWADFLRHRIDVALVEKDFDRALRHALKEAHSAAAAYLPGWVTTG